MNYDFARWCFRLGSRKPFSNLFHLLMIGWCILVTHCVHSDFFGRTFLNLEQLTPWWVAGDLKVYPTELWVMQTCQKGRIILRQRQPKKWPIYRLLPCNSETPERSILTLTSHADFETLLETAVLALVTVVLINWAWSESQKSKSNTVETPNMGLLNKEQSPLFDSKSKSGK